MLPTTGSFMHEMCLNMCQNQEVASSFVRGICEKQGFYLWLQTTFKLQHFFKGAISPERKILLCRQLFGNVLICICGKIHVFCFNNATRILFQVIAREDKGSLGIDYNRSPTVYFRTEVTSNTSDTNTTTVSYNRRRHHQSTEKEQTKRPPTTFAAEKSEVFLLQQILVKIDDLKRLLLRRENKDLSLQISTQKMGIRITKYNLTCIFRKRRLRIKKIQKGLLGPPYLFLRSGGRRRFCRYDGRWSWRL